MTVTSLARRRRPSLRDHYTSLARRCDTNLASGSRRGNLLLVRWAPWPCPACSFPSSRADLMMLGSQNSSRELHRLAGLLPSELNRLDARERRRSSLSPRILRGLPFPCRALGLPPTCHLRPRVET